MATINQALVSPGVFTQESDQTFLPQGIANIGGAIVGPFPRGAGFAPTLVTNQGDLQTLFGVPDGRFYAPYTAQQYLGQSGTVTIVRVGQLGGYFQKNALILEAESGSMASLSGSFLLSNFTASAGGERVVLGVLANTAYDSGQLWQGFLSSSLVAVTSSAAPTTEFSLNLYNTSASFYGKYNFSLNSSSPSFITNVFGENAQVGYSPIPSGSLPKAAYLKTVFPGEIDSVVSLMLASGSYRIKLSVSDVSGSFALQFTDGIAGGGDATNEGSAYDLREAVTPWINSQDMDGTKYQLFKFHTLTDGTNANTDVKVVISNIKLSGTIPGSDYGSFTVTVRNGSDSDSRPEVYDSFPNVTLDPNSSNFIGRRIGDQWSSIDFNGKVNIYGDFANKSKYIRVETTQAPYPETVVPYGNDAYTTPIGGFFANYVPAVQYTSASVYSRNIGRYASGFCFGPAPIGADAELSALYPSGVSTNASDNNYQYLAPIPVSATSGSNQPFDLQTNCGISPIFDPVNEPSNVKKRVFAVAFQQGFDGGAPGIIARLGSDILPTNQQGLDCSTILSSGSVGYKQALAAIGNVDEFDINLLALPGINYNDHPYVAQLSIDTVENRGDAFLIVDLYGNQTPGGNSISNVISIADEIDSNYAASYYPWVKILDTNTNKIVTVPPSVVMPAVFAQNDKVSAEWFAPAGLNRGGITQAVQVVDRLTNAERDTLYDGRINPIAAFPGQGIVAWGQKTLQQKPSALDRVNVRRLLINLKKFLASTSKYLVFEQNISSTRNKFLSIANPYLESVQQRSGLTAFKVVMDDTNNTPDIIDRNILVGTIYIQPSRTAEFVVLQFNILPTGATFPNG